MKGQTPNRSLPAGGRVVRLAEMPTVSVVVTSCGERSRLDDCLKALLPQCREAEAEVVVTRKATPAEISELSSTYPTVWFAAAPQEIEESAMRAWGMAEVSGDIVLLRSDDAVVENWVPRRLIALRERAGVGAGEPQRAVTSNAHRSGDQEPGVRPSNR